MVEAVHGRAQRKGLAANNTHGLYARQVGVGLLGMKERLALLGGWLQVESHTSQGTRLVAALPLGENGSEE